MQRHGGRDQDGREQEVPGHKCWIQTGENRQAAKDRLADHSEQPQGGEQHQRSTAWNLSPRGHDADDDDQDDDEGQQPVAELDELVEALGLSGDGHDGARRALRPGRAAKA